jgi:hypothetical protein
VDGLAGTISYLAAIQAPLVRPADLAFASYVDVSPGEIVRLAVARVKTGNCTLRVRLRDDGGQELVAAQEISSNTKGGIGKCKSKRKPKKNKPGLVKTRGAWQ